jgi:stress response protein YsnF
MSRTVTSLYDTRAEAEAARQRLTSELDVAGARILDQQSHASGEPDGSLDRLTLSDDDRAAYQEALRRGGFLLSAEVRGHEDADRIIALLEESASVDLDRRQDEWRGEGWSPDAGAAAAGQHVAEERVPIVEEQLVVGKREVERGSARVRSHVREVPVHEQVTLREEHVSVERHPVNQRLESDQLEASDMLRDRDVQVTAMAEEPVVSKEARVSEEVVVRKEVEERVEQVEGKVARTQVDVDEGSADAAGRSAFGGFGNPDAGLGGTGSDPERDRPR